MTKARRQAEIKAVFFDIGNVLLRFDAKRVAAKIAWALRSNPLKVARYLWTSKAVEAIERGELSSRAIYGLFRSDLGYEGSFKGFTRLWCDHFTLDRRTAALLLQIRKSGKRRVYLLSNTNDLHYLFIKKHYAFARRVHGAILSHKVGMRKPEPGIYKAAVKLAGVRASECLFIDDLKVNVDAAARLGFRVIHHEKGHDLRASLAALGLP